MNTTLNQFFNDKKEISDFKDKIVITINGEDVIQSLSYFDLDYNSSLEEIINTIKPAILEVYNIDITNFYRVYKSKEDSCIYVIPNSIAG